MNNGIILQLKICQNLNNNFTRGLIGLINSSPRNFAINFFANKMKIFIPPCQQIVSSIFTGFLFCCHLFPQIRAQNGCSEAPTQALQTVCEQISRWDERARIQASLRENSSRFPSPPAIPGLPNPMIGAELAPIAATPFQCMDLGCLCSYMGGIGRQGSNDCTLANGQRLGKAIRKEYRTLSDEERVRFHAAMRSLKNSGEYDRIAAIHAQFATSGSAHSGPGFLPWHREFLKQVEISLRQIDSSLAIPYWDSTLDWALPNARHSIMWTEDFMGDTDRQGNLVTGEFSNWRTLMGRPNILRSVGAQGKLFSESEIQSVLGQTSYRRVLAFTVPRAGCPERINWNDIEYTHGNVHIFMGGDMLDQTTAANDPIFFLHHSFVDMIWEIWRQRHQTRSQRELEYPEYNSFCASPQHAGLALMRPFEPWQNVDGLNNKYTDNMFEYAPRPSCDNTQSCGSKYLFCDRSQSRPRCVAKVRLGGICTGFASEEVCYRGVCQDGRCVEIQQENLLTREIQSSSATQQQDPFHIPNKSVTPFETVACYNENECCSIWESLGECDRNPQYMKIWCKASCRECRPNYDEGIECSDRHRNCMFWARIGECQRNLNWMNENCRQSCDRCNITRQEICWRDQINHAANSVVRPLPSPPRGAVEGNITQCAPSDGCYNEHICCHVWSSSNKQQCSRNPWMGCNCRVSCGQCIPREYTPESCSDYHPKCKGWALLGECRRNHWMLTNCRRSCGTCFSRSGLRRLCSLVFEPNDVISSISRQRIQRIRPSDKREEQFTK